MSKSKPQEQPNMLGWHRHYFISMFELFFGPFTVEKARARVKAAEEAALRDDMLVNRLGSLHFHAPN
ncbi:hypothetical protein FQN49_002832 [Arthroderma sp. PD_2]|nr:hypothetical protein FQN49_002832 [Arthroderma sp. PD_2]